ncbi:MAG: cell division protein FtsL, partial [Dialister sp.]|nr:cell division protein FtsL [Dialister sp.]
ILGTLMILFPVMLLVFLSGINIQEEYRMQRIRSEVMTMAKENAVDKLEVSRLEAPVRIQQIAEQKLKMSLPVRVVYGSADPAKPHPNKGR